MVGQNSGRMKFQKCHYSYIKWNSRIHRMLEIFYNSIMVKEFYYGTNTHRQAYIHTYVYKYIYICQELLKLYTHVYVYTMLIYFDRFDRFDSHIYSFTSKIAYVFITRHIYLFLRMPKKCQVIGTNILHLGAIFFFHIIDSIIVYTGKLCRYKCHI